jgi:hypothetical protein
VVWDGSVVEMDTILGEGRTAGRASFICGPADWSLAGRDETDLAIGA